MSRYFESPPFGAPGREVFELAFAAPKAQTVTSAIANAELPIVLNPGRCITLFLLISATYLMLPLPYQTGLNGL